MKKYKADLFPEIQWHPRYLNTGHWRHLLKNRNTNTGACKKSSLLESLNKLNTCFVNVQTFHHKMKQRSNHDMYVKSAKKIV